MYRFLLTTGTTTEKHKNEGLNFDLHRIIESNVEKKKQLEIMSKLPFALK